LTGLLPGSLPLHPDGLQILPSKTGAQKIGGSRQYINSDNDQIYVRVSVLEFPQTEED